MGKQIAGIINKGNLVPDEMMVSTLEKIVSSTQQGIIFDGFPRTVAQAEALDDMMQRLHREITKVVMIDLPENEVINRISSRRQCTKCGEILRVNLNDSLKNFIEHVFNKG